jgi:adenylate kinase
LVSLLILVLGTSGAGKSTLGRALAERAGHHYVYASGMKLTMVGPDEPINLYGQAQTDELNQRMFDALPPGPAVTLVDTHAVYPVGDGFVRLTPPSAAPRIAGIVMIEADAATVSVRRAQRGRPTEATELAAVVRELEAERVEVDRLSRTHAIPVCTVDSATVPVDEAVSVAAAFVASLLAARDDARGRDGAGQSDRS